MFADDEEEVMSWVNDLANDSQAGDIRGVAIIAMSYKEMCDSQKMMINAMYHTLGVVRDMCGTLIDIYERAGVVGDGPKETEDD
jgi:hypothetical protein